MCWEFRWLPFLLSLLLSKLIALRAGRRVAGGPGLVATGQGPAGLAPVGLDVVLLAHVAPAYRSHDPPIGEAHDPCSHSAIRVLVHERHELVREPRHRAGHADPADVGATPHPALPTANRDVAFHHRALAAQFHQAAMVGSVLSGV